MRPQQAVTEAMSQDPLLPILIAPMSLDEFGDLALVSPSVHWGANAMTLPPWVTVAL